MRRDKKKPDFDAPQRVEETEALRKAAAARKRTQLLMERAEELRATAQKLHRRAENLHGSIERAQKGFLRAKAQ